MRPCVCVEGLCERAGLTSSSSGADLILPPESPGPPARDPVTSFLSLARQRGQAPGNAHDEWRLSARNSTGFSRRAVC
jgi:hypothetical protein